jgi:hypothetical protein
MASVVPVPTAAPRAPLPYRYAVTVAPATRPLVTVPEIVPPLT